MEDKILDIFYNKFIEEIKSGKIDCYFTLNIVFNVIIDNKLISKANELSYDGILVPTLKITNKKVFDKLLVEYVSIAKTFYNKDFNFLDDLEDETLKEEYLIKYIIGTLFANASFSDFDNPINFLNTRINFFKNKILENEIDFYINSINARLYVNEVISPITCETPYRLESYLIFDDGYKLKLPNLYVGNDGTNYLLYAIQKIKNNNELEESIYLKQIRNGLVAKIKGAPEHYFIAVMLMISLCSDKDIVIVPFLIERWNAKRIAMYKKSLSNENLLDMELNQEKIQNNLTDILIRYFTKLESVSEGIEFSSINEVDSNLYIKIKENFNSKSVAFNEIFNAVKENKYKKSNLNK